MTVVTANFSVTTTRRTELIDITCDVNAAIRAAGVRTGIVSANTAHTTAALLINEFEPALMDDLVSLAERLVPATGAYRHNDARYSDCERGNAQAHLRAALFGRSVAVPIEDGGVVLGEHQAIIFAEFDGPRRRDITIQMIGE